VGGMGFTSRMMDPGAWDAWVVLTWLVVVVLIAAVAAVVVWALRGERSSGRATPVAPSPGDILDERFARGEISDEELQRRRQALTNR
jgi:putative membrane protein